LVLNTGGNALQTVALVPSEGQNGEVQYVLLVTQPADSSGPIKELGTVDLSSVLGYKVGLYGDV
jgi:hypothetical protein